MSYVFNAFELILLGKLSSFADGDKLALQYSLLLNNCKHFFRPALKAAQIPTLLLMPQFKSNGSTYNVKGVPYNIV